MKPIINPISEKLLVATVKKLPQSLLLTGEIGVGISVIAKYIAELSDVKPTLILPEKDEKIDEKSGVISIDSIRHLFNETRTISVKKRIIIIDYAERMTIQAQNAFLKLLEEPNKNVNYILASHSEAKLLPTILSRTEKIDIKPATIKQSNDLLDVLGVSDVTKRSQLLFIAYGKPAELTRLVNDDYFAKRSSIVRDARELLRGSTYQKLQIAHKYRDDRQAVLILLLDVANMVRLSIIDNPQVDTIRRIDSILDAYNQIEANGNIRLCMARLVL